MDGISTRVIDLGLTLLRPRAQAPAPARVAPRGMQLRQYQGQALGGANALAAAPAFSFTPVQTRDHRAAIDGPPGTGVAANRQISADYHAFNGRMQSYLNTPGLPGLADWMAFAKYASREAGEQIRNLENIALALHGNPLGAGAALASLFDGNQLLRSFLLAGGDRITAANLRNPIWLVRNAASMVRTLQTMRRSLVAGNTRVHHNIAPAYNAFLRGEANGQGGMAALRAAGYTPNSPNDPQGWITQAFECYSAARRQGQAALGLPDGPARQAALAERQRLTERANFLLGMQEQYSILQGPEIFGHPRMRAAMGAIAGTMTITDANGTHRLLPKGGNWADFVTRMGLREVPQGTANAIALRGANGQTTYYVPDPTRTGTIADYFTSNLTGPRARALIAAPPRPLASLPGVSLLPAAASGTFLGFGGLQAAFGPPR